MKCSGAAAGFTWLEVLVALVILGLAPAFLTGTISYAAGNPTAIQYGTTSAGVTQNISYDPETERVASDAATSSSSSRPIFTINDRHIVM